MVSTLNLLLWSLTLLQGEVVVTGCCNDMTTKFTAILMDYNTRLNSLLMNVSNFLAENEGLSIPAYRDCLETFQAGYVVSRVYNISIGGNLVEAYCDMETDGGGWTVFQRRLDGSVDFLRNWDDYTKGFGNKNGEYWLGNNNLHQLTVKSSELRVDLEAFDDREDLSDTKVYAKYKSFAVGDGTTSYRLTIDGYSGTAGDSMRGHNNFPFTTKDRDNDIWGSNCAVKFEGAWWYTKCHASNLNGKYLRGTTETYANGVVWKHYTGYHYSLKSSTMMVREIK